MTQNDFFNRYKYDPDEDHLGEGGFGKVFKAFDDTLDRHIAIKIAAVKKGQESLSLQKEVELAKKLPKHRNIAHYEACYRFKSPQGTFDYGILQYYPMGNLSQLIRQEKLNIQQKESIAQGIIAGLKLLHHHDITHRDLKSSNILITKRSNGQYIPKVADFGLSKQITNLKNSYFGNSFGGGSLLYAAPEQLTTGNIRKNVDLWSLGVVLYELFTGKLPFLPDSDIASETGRMELVKKINSGTIPEDIKSVPQNWQKLIEACLIVDAEKRLKTILQVKQILNGGLKKEIPKKIASQVKNEFVSDYTVIDVLKPRSSHTNKGWAWYRSAILGLLLLFIGYFIYGNFLTAPKKYDELGEFSEGLAAVKLNSKWGFIDKEGNEVIPVKYDDTGEFHDGLVSVELNKKEGFINKQGKEVTPIKYDYVSYFIEDLAEVWMNSKGGIIDKEGKELTPLKYDFIAGFHDGLAAVKLNSKWGLIDKEGHEVIPIKYNNDDLGFSDGLTRVRLNGKEGFIDKKGMEVIPIKYESVYHFREGYACVKLDSKYGVINKVGEIIIPFKYDNVIEFKEGLAVVESNSKCGVLNKFGEMVIPIIYDYLGNFSEGLAVAELNSKRGAIDMNGKINIPFIYDNILPFKDGFAKTRLNKKYGIIDKTGKIMIPNKYEFIGDFKEGFARVSIVGGKRGFIDKQGKEIFPIQYDQIYDFNNGLAKVWRNSKKGFIDTEGNEVIPIKYDDARIFRDGLCRVEIDNRFFFINRSDECVLNCPSEL